MLTILFIFLMIAVFGKLAWFGLKATWGLTKLLFTILFLPVILIGLFLSGLVVVAIPILLILGISALLLPKAV